MPNPPESPRSGDSPTSENFSTATTATESAASPPECEDCQKIFHTLSVEEQSKWPPKEKFEIPCHGWPCLAELMFKHPGFESFQAFRDLRIKSLLYYQAELVKLRQELHILEWENHSNGDFVFSDQLSERVDFLLKTETMSSPEDKGKKQILKIKEIRKVLKEYMIPKGEEMLLYTRINDLPEPQAFGVNNLLNLLKEKPYPIGGPGVDSWGKFKAMPEEPMPIWPRFRRLVRTIFWEKDRDKLDLGLVVPRKNIEVDGLTRWVYTEGVPFWDIVCFEWNKFWQPTQGLPSPSPDSPQRRRSSASGATFVQWLRQTVSNGSQEPKKSEIAEDGQLKIVKYRVKRLVAFTAFITTVVASLLPIVAIVVLSKLHKQPMILGFIALFTGLFTMGLMVLTPSGTSRTEIFTASAAFSAVMVVFVQNQSGGNGS